MTIPNTDQAQLTVLVVDDDVVIQKLVAGILRPMGLSILTVTNGEAGIALAREQPVDLILLDNEMPGASGLDILRLLKSDAQLASVPVIMVTGSEGSKVLSAGFSAGAVDYLRKPFSAAELRARVNSVLERQRLMAALTSAARTDRLTGLANRAQLMDRLSSAVQLAKDDAANAFTIMFLDFDRFKFVNDTLGHDVGDQLLQAISGRLLHNLRGGDASTRELSNTVVARLGGDEFVVILGGVDSPASATLVANRLQAALDRPYQLGPHIVRSTASIGSVCSAPRYETADEMLRDADIAMYAAKARGKACHVTFSEDMREGVAHQIKLESSLHTALGTPEIYVAFQPVFALDQNTVCGVEAMARWAHPTLGNISPDVFIPLAEETGHMLQLGEDLMRLACQQFLQLQRQVPAHASAQLEYVSVHLSRIQLADPALVARTLRILGECNLAPEQLQIEVTESQLLQHRQVAQDVLAELSRNGVRTAIDNFGSGYSSLGCLQDFSIDTVKIDKTLVANASRGRGFAALLHAILDLAENLDLLAVAKGVETAEQLALLEALGCGYAQGSLFVTPMRLHECVQFLSERTANSVLPHGVAA